MKKLTPGQKVTLTVGLVTAIVGLISALAVIIAAGIQRPREIEAKQMEINATQTAEARLTILAPTFTPTFTPTSTNTPSPTITPTATMDNTEPNLPTGYVYFDNFDKPNDPDGGIWKIYSQNGDCSQIQNTGLLNINCAATSQNVSFDMKPVDVLYLKVSGVAMASRVLSDDDKGNLAVVVTLTGVNGDKRYYKLRSNASKFWVDEVNGKDWKSIKLAEVQIEPGVIHITRVEFKNDILSVWVDDKQVQMQTNLPVSASLTNWNIEPIVYCENCGEGNLVANIFWMALLK